MKKIILFCLFALLVVGCKEKRELVILHTNDVHSQVEATKSGLGGYLNLLAHIDSVRSSDNDVLLLDAGDFFQGTPYFNLWNGAVEIESMNLMGYDAVTLGNHEFDLGMDTLVKQLRKAKFDIVCSNYEISHPGLSQIVKPYTILVRGAFKIGIIGLGVNLEGLAFGPNFEGLKYKDPIETVEKYSHILKNENCNFIIVLSHLGYTTANINDSILAAKTKDIDMILGGHTHKDVGVFNIPNIEGKNVIVSQTSSKGSHIGEIRVNRK